MIIDENAALRFSTNGRMTYEIAFNSFNRELKEVGIDKLAKFRAVLHSVQNMECEERRRRLDAQSDGHGKSSKKVGEKHLNETANCGTISSMAKGFKNATLALALTAVGVVASCRASGASPDISRGGGWIFSAKLRRARLRAA